jgi:hypothetical protein
MRYAAMNVAAAERLRAVQREKEDEVTRVEGSDSQWHELDQQFRALPQAVRWTECASDDLAAELGMADPHSLADDLLALFECQGSMSIGPRRGPWIVLTLADGKPAGTGLSESQILAGDPRVAALILVAVVDSNLHQRGGRRDSWPRVSVMMRLLHQTVAALGPRPSDWSSKR